MRKKFGITFDIEDDPDWTRISIETYAFYDIFVFTKDYDIVIYPDKKSGYCDRYGSLRKLSKEEIEEVLDRFDINAILNKSGVQNA